MNASDQISLFYSYSYAHEDEKHLDELKKHMRPLVRPGGIDACYDRNSIRPGTEREREINKHLNSARIILLLISPDFISSDDCSKEMEQAMARYEQREANVIPILLRPVNIQDFPISRLTPLPRNRKPVTRWRSRDEAFQDIEDGIRRVVDDLRKPPPQEDPELIIAFQALKKGSNEQKDAVQCIINVLDKLSREQKEVSELKSVHNKLHKIEAALAPLRDRIFDKNREAQKVVDIDSSIKNLWWAVWSEIGSLQYFAEQEMRYLEKKRFKVEELLNLQDDFDAALEERNIQEMMKISQDLSETCRIYLQVIDSNLLEAVNQVDQLSDQILRSLHYGSTTNA